ncbi:phage tail protein [Clostridium carboxidivorans]|uniref:phage tail protein n=1 Tax=Clostridium carboxidivorans TaxID=217159 RepID=UPI001F60E2E4|nr:phage tail protein [Clostridium carboxidivorans]
MAQCVDNAEAVTLTANNIPAHIHPITSNVTGGGGTTPVNVEVKIPVNTDAYNAATVLNTPGNTCTLGIAKTSGGQTANIYTTNSPTTGANLKPFNVQANITVPAPTVTSTCNANVPNPFSGVRVMPSYLCVGYIICVQGIFPSRE